ncbi:MAG: Mo-dependent nitrogenase C-terminal domain-containing protein [Leptolyngbya sp. BL-A-14]
MKTAHAPVPDSLSNQIVPKQIVWEAQEPSMELTSATMVSTQQHSTLQRFAPLQPIRQWLDTIEIRDPEMANLLCQMIPSRCPFARTVKLFDRTLFSIPPLCKLNPFYEQVVGLRFRALCYLADECSVDVSRYC